MRRVHPGWVEMPSWLTSLHFICVDMEKNKVSQLIFQQRLQYNVRIQKEDK